jgi:hypothetical protein
VHGSPLPPWRPASFLRWGAAAAACLVLAIFLGYGTYEFKVACLLTFGIGFFNPVRGLLLIALLAPLALLDHGKTHMLVVLEALALGIVAGDFVRWVPGSRLGNRVIHWGLWPHFLAGLFVLLLSSSLVGAQLVWLREHFFGESGWRARFTSMFFLSATAPEWSLKSLWNWTLSMAVAVVAARRMDELALARWLKLAALSMLAACVLALAAWVAQRFPGWTYFSLDQLRFQNPDPVQAGRLQGTAGHPGWFAQWLIVAWPGLLLWWAPGADRRNGLILAAGAVALLTLLLTAARACWLGFAVSALVGGFFLARHYPAARAKLPLLIGVGAALLVLGTLVAGPFLLHRLENLLRAQDRLNYYITGLIFFREHPFGLGLGTHYQFYGWLIPPGFRWGQFDFVDSHNLILHTLIENGPFVPLMMLAGALGVGLEVRSAWSYTPNPDERKIIGAAGLALIGLAVVSFAQYIVYIRVIELSLWILCGAVVGCCRRKRSLMEARIDSPRGLRLLLACGLAAALTASMNSSRTYAGEVPRARDLDPEGNLSLWIDRRWRVAVTEDVDRIEFHLLRKASPVWGHVTWPDGTVEPFHLIPGPMDRPGTQREASQHFRFERPARVASPLAAPQWLIIDAAPAWSPADFDPDSDDTRDLGVYIGGLEIDSQWRREILAEIERRQQVVPKGSIVTE